MASFTVRHKVNRRGGRIRVRKFSAKGREHYQIRVSIVGPLEQIEQVQYDLHPTFVNPVRQSTNRDSGFAIDMWTWGEFELLATARFLDGHTEDVPYDLQFSGELPADEDSYVDETPSNVS